MTCKLSKRNQVDLEQAIVWILNKNIFFWLLHRVIRETYSGLMVHLQPTITLSVVNLDLREYILKEMFSISKNNKLNAPFFHLHHCPFGEFSFCGARQIVSSSKGQAVNAAEFPFVRHLAHPSSSVRSYSVNHIPLQHIFSILVHLFLIHPKSDIFAGRNYYNL